MRLRSWKQRGRRTLVAAALTTTVVAGTTGWAVGSEQSPLTGPPPGAASWRADHALGGGLPDPGTAKPVRVTAFFRGLDAAERQQLVERHPTVVGNLDGAPADLRYEANARALKAERDRVRVRARDASLTSQDRAQARFLVTRYTELLEPGRQILAFDPRGRGQVAEVFGDLAVMRPCFRRRARLGHRPELLRPGQGSVRHPGGDGPLAVRGVGRPHRGRGVGGVHDACRPGTRRRHRPASPRRAHRG